jgi:hypothetical protein
MPLSAALQPEYRPGDVLSPSSCNQCRRCPAQWKFRHIDHLPDPPTGALTQGSAIHAALGENSRQKIETKQDLSPAGVKAIYREAWDLLVKGEYPDPFGRPKLPTEFRDDEDPGQLKLEGEALALKYLDERACSIQPAAVELRVDGRIGGVEVRGFIDLLDTEGRIIDLKTVKRSPSEDKVSPDHRFQVATYRKLLPGKISGVGRIDSLVKNKTPKLVTQEYRITDADLAECDVMYPLVQHYVRQGVFLPNRSSTMCSRKYCSFWRACEKTFGGEVAE